jgi:hypothetical protein
LAATLCFVSIAGCGGGEKSERVEQQVRGKVKKALKEAQQKTGNHDARAAFEMALQEAQKWDSKARLYQIEGKNNLQSDGTALMWTAYFATQEDPENVPSEERGKKLVVLMMPGNVIRVQKKETPEEKSWIVKCHAFLPDDWMDSGEAFSKCHAALKDKHGAEAEAGRAKHLILHSYAYYTPGGSGWQRKPAWELSVDIAGSPASAEVHAVTGEILEVK